MKTTVLLLAGVSLGLASLLLSRKRIASTASEPVALDELAHKLEAAWAGNHTIA